MTVEKIVMATNSSGLNTTYLLMSEERRERERRERPKATIVRRRASEEDHRREVSMLHLETCLIKTEVDSFVSSYYVVTVFLHWIYSNRAAIKIRLLFLAGVFIGFLVEKCAV